MRLKDPSIADAVEGFISHCPLITDEGRACLVPRHFVHDRLSCAERYLWISGGEIGSGDLKIQDWLARRFVLSTKKRLGFAFVFGAQADLFAAVGVFTVKDSTATE